jgi:hypothetical protein
MLHSSLQTPEGHLHYRLMQVPFGNKPQDWAHVEPNQVGGTGSSIFPGRGTIFFVGHFVVLECFRDVFKKVPAHHVTD